MIQTECHKNAGMNPDQYAQFLEKSTTTHALGRYGQPEEVGKLLNCLIVERRVDWLIAGGRSDSVPVHGEKQLYYRPSAEDRWRQRVGNENSLHLYGI